MIVPTRTQGKATYILAPRLRSSGKIKNQVYALYWLLLLRAALLEQLLPAPFIFASCPAASLLSRLKSISILGIASLAMPPRD
jgi:hypothetical protein